MFSQTAEYAIRAVAWLAEHGEEGAARSHRIAKDTHVPPTYLAKVLQQLAKAGIVYSRRGAGGGFNLAHDPKKLTVLDVVNAVDPPKRFTHCPLHLTTYKTGQCPMHAHLDEATARIEEVLAVWSIDQILHDASRSRPKRKTKSK